VNQPKNESRIERKKNVTLLYRGLWIVCTLLALSDFFYHKHTVYKIESFPAFYGFYGFIVCVGLVLGAKQLHRFLKRAEDYYDR
jgi:hypothetical protein